MPRRMSVWPVAIHTRTPLGIGMIVRPERSEPAEAHRRRRCCRRARGSRSQFDFDDARPRSASARRRARRSRRLHPDGAAIAPISTGSKTEPSLLAGSAVRASLRHVKSRLCATPCRRATSLTTAPGIVSLQRSATSRPCSTAVGARSPEPSHPSLRDLKASPKVTPFATTQLPSKAAAPGRLPSTCLSGRRTPCQIYAKGSRR